MCVAAQHRRCAFCPMASSHIWPIGMSWVQLRDSHVVNHETADHRRCAHSLLGRWEDHTRLSAMASPVQRQEHRPDKVSSEACSDTREESLTSRLKSWFDWFRVGSVQRGLVDYWRDDGTRCKRHGVILTLHAHLSKRLEDDSGVDAGVRKLREAIDLVQLVLAVDPKEIKPLVEGKYKLYRSDDTHNEENEGELLDMIVRGVPVELRLRFAATATLKTVALLKDPAMIEAMKAYDTKLSTDKTFLVMHSELMKRIEKDEAKLLGLQTMTVHAVLDTQFQDPLDCTEATSVAFLDSLASFSAAISGYYREREALNKAAAISSRHVAFEIETIHLELESEMSRTVVESAMKLVAAGIPVDWSPLYLIIRGPGDCDEDQLCRFVEAAAEQSFDLRIVTTVYEAALLGRSADANGEDHQELISTRSRAIAHVCSRVREVDIGGWLECYDEDYNREAIWRGLFEDILSADTPLETLTLSQGVQLRDKDATWIEQSASKWRVVHREKKLQLRCLNLDLYDPSCIALCALLSAFDDIEEISVVHPTEFHEPPISIEVVDALLRFPSLRNLRVDNIEVPTMDCFDPSIADESRPCKPVLEELELNEIVLEDASSLSRFFSSLDPSTSTNPLATTLRKLHVTQGYMNAVDFYDSTTIAALDAMLQSNYVLQDIAVTEVNNHEPDMWDDQEQDMDDDGELSKQGELDQVLVHDGSRLPAPYDSPETALAKARNVAFLSTLYAETSGGTSSARHHLDTMLIRQILAFSAPVVTRKIHKHWLDQEERRWSM